MHVIVNEMLTHYTRNGKGRLILIIPGWADTSKSWLAMQNKLTADFDVLVLDLPGFGDSQAPGTAWGLDEYARFVGAFLIKLDANAVYAIIGHSNGGAIALRGIARQNFSPDRLVLLASAGIRDTYKGRNKALRLLVKTGKLIAMPLPRGLKKRLREQVYSAVGSDMLVAEHMQETFKKIVNDDVQADAQVVDIPALLIYGDKDAQTPLVYGQAFHELLADSTLEIVEGGEHFLHTEHTDRIIHDVQEFLRA